MAELRETVIFRGDDAPCLVQASLACRVCLSGDVEFSLAGECWDIEVECRCLSCGARRTVGLTDEQALRLSLQQPVGRA